MNHLRRADGDRILFAYLQGFCEILKELNHVLGIDEENVLHELGLQSLAVLVDVFVEVERQLVDNWHASFDDIEYVLSILQQTLVPLDIFEPFNDVRRVIYIQLQLLSYQISSYFPQSSPDVAEQL